MLTSINILKTLVLQGINCGVWSVVIIASQVDLKGLSTWYILLIHHFYFLIFF